MRELTFFIFSMVDSTALLLLILSVFRFDIRKSFGSLILSSFIFTLFSSILIYVGLDKFTIPIQMVITIFLFRLIFKESGKYSIFISLVGYVTYLAMQGVLASIFISYNVMTQSDLQPYSPKGYIAQVISLGVVIVITIFMRKMNEGFSFDFDNPFGRKMNLHPARPYLVIATIAAIITAVVYPKLDNNLSLQFSVSIIMNIICFIALIFMSIKRNRMEVSSATT